MNTLILALALGAASANANVTEGLFDDSWSKDPIVKAAARIAQQRYGVHCNFKKARGAITVGGYYNDLKYIVNLPCGNPKAEYHHESLGGFKELNLRFLIIESESTGEIHVTCMERQFIEPVFGARDGIDSCKVPAGFGEWEYDPFPGNGN